MIDFIKTYYGKSQKGLLLNLIYEKKIFKNVELKRNPITEKDDYPILAELPGIFGKVDKYRSYLSIDPLIVYNSISEYKNNRFEGLTFYEFQGVLEHIINQIDGFSSAIISKLTIGLSINIEENAREFIINNIISKRTEFYNHNIKPGSKLEMKEFISNDYQIGFYANKSSSNQNITNFLRVKLSISGDILKKTKILTPKDLLNEESMKALFDLLLKYFDEIIILDDKKIDNSQDAIKLKDFKDITFWSKIKDRQKKYREFKLYKSLIRKYKLDSKKNFMRQELIQYYQYFTRCAF